MEHGKVQNSLQLLAADTSSSKTGELEDRKFLASGTTFFSRIKDIIIRLFQHKPLNERKAAVEESPHLNLNIELAKSIDIFKKFKDLSPKNREEWLNVRLDREFLLTIAEFTDDIPRLFEMFESIDCISDNLRIQILSEILKRTDDTKTSFIGNSDRLVSMLNKLNPVDLKTALESGGSALSKSLNSEQFNEVLPKCEPDALCEIFSKFRCCGLSNVIKAGGKELLNSLGIDNLVKLLSKFDFAELGSLFNYNRENGVLDFLSDKAKSNEEFQHLIGALLNLDPDSLS